MGWLATVLPALLKCIYPFVRCVVACVVSRRWRERGSLDTQKANGRSVTSINVTEFGETAPDLCVLLRGAHPWHLDKLSFSTDTMINLVQGCHWTHTALVVRAPPAHVLASYGTKPHADPEWARRQLYMWEMTKGAAFLAPFPDKVQDWAEKYHIRDGDEWNLALLPLVSKATKEPLGFSEVPDVKGLWAFIERSVDAGWVISKEQACNMCRFLCCGSIASTRVSLGPDEVAVRRKRMQDMICSEATAEALHCAGLLQRNYSAEDYVPLSFCPSQYGAKCAAVGKNLIDGVQLGDPLELLGVHALPRPSPPGLKPAPAP